MSSTPTSDFAMQTDTNGAPPQSTPPLLPAFLITGLLLAAIIFIIVWRHLIERRNARREGSDDPTWPAEGMSGGSGGPKGPTPKLWELPFASESARASWADIMPLSAAPLRASPKPRRPRFLVPSDRPVPFFTRMFGSDRRPPVPSTRPISVLQPACPSTVPPEEEDPVDRLQVAVLISFPHRRRIRRASYLPEKDKRGSDVPSLPPEKGSLKTVGEESEAESPCPDKGKKRSLDTPLSMMKGYYDCDDEEGPLEVAFGTIILPFVKDEDERGIT